MKVCVVQPPYYMDYARSDECFRWEMDAFDRCDASMDLIVFPEYSNSPSLTMTREQLLENLGKYADALCAKAAETARRCNAVVMVNGIFETPSGLRNTTTVFGRDGEIAGQYFKQHLVPSEMYTYELDKDYTFEFSEPTILEVDGVRYGFLVCYDAYFYEAFSNIARYNPDVIVACSHQRSDSHDALEMMHRFCAYNTNAWVVRASISLGADSPNGGTSLVIAPDGRVLVNMMNETGFGVAEIDPHQRYLKPAGFGNPPATHHSYIEAGRRPWKYRPGGSAIVLPDKWMPYPRICAHRGFNTIAPENSMPAFGAAVALGAEEIEFDLWAAKDGTIISLHDPDLDRVSDGHGFIWDHTYEELKRVDFGSRFGPEYKGLGVVTFEDILRKFACHTVMNVHVKSPDNANPLPESTVRSIISLIRKYDCEQYCYIMTGNMALMNQFRALAPELGRCMGAGDDPRADLVDKALACDCQKIQLFKPHFRDNPPDYLEKAVAKAHANNIRCNIFWSDDPDETARYLDMGIDVILTNDYHRNAARR